MQMRFSGFLRPFQGFKYFSILRRNGTVTATGRPVTGEFEEIGELLGIISEASQQEQEQWKQNGHPITHTIVQKGPRKAKPTDVLTLENQETEEVRRFMIKGAKDPGEIGHFTIYYVEERLDLQ